MLEVGSEMSCLMFSPSCACASGMCSRSCHSACACARLSATLASPIVPASSAWPSRASKPRAPGGLALGVVDLQQHRPGCRRQRPRQRRVVGLDERQRVTPHDLEAGQPAGQPRARQAQQRQRGVEAVAARQGGQRGRRLRAELQRGGGDHAQRALAADEQVAQVVAGVVLAQARQAVPDLALRRHDLQPQAQPACVAEAQHLGAAGVGRQVAADRAAALGRQAEREAQPVPGCRLLHRLQHAAGLGHQGQVVGVDGADAVQARQAQQQLRAAGVGHAAADHAGVAALRHDGHAVLGAGAHDRRHLGRAARPHDRQRAAVPAASPVGLPGVEVAVDEQVRHADRVAQRVQQRGRRRPVGAHRAHACRARCSRQRTCSAQAPNSSRLSATSSPASVADRPASL
jgi:hypothetical protein